MKIAIACDHSGLPLVQTVIEAVAELGCKPVFLGTRDVKSVDYPDMVVKTGRAIQSGEADRGILLCASGIGMNIAANKIHGIYASICHDAYSAHQGVEHDNMNVLCLGAGIIGSMLAKDIVATFLKARYIGNDPGEERHARRVEKTRKLESTFNSR